MVCPANSSYNFQVDKVETGAFNFLVNVRFIQRSALLRVWLRQVPLYFRSVISKYFLLQMENYPLSVTTINKSQQDMVQISVTAWHLINWLKGETTPVQSPIEQQQLAHFMTTFYICGIFLHLKHLTIRKMKHSFMQYFVEIP